MFRILGFIFLILILIIILVEPVRNFMNNLFRRDKDEIREEQFIGRFSGYNPRVEELQKILKDAGFEPGPVDGVMGSQTRRVIREFQKIKGLRVTGRIDSQTWLELNREKEVMSSLKKKGKDELIAFTFEEKPTDIKSKDEIQKIMGPQDKGMKEKLPIDKTKQIQLALKKANFYKGEIDGKIGPQTKRAIRAFQKSKGLKSDGIVGSKTWEELSKYLKD